MRIFGQEGPQGFWVFVIVMHDANQPAFIVHSVKDLTLLRIRVVEGPPVWPDGERFLLFSGSARFNGAELWCIPSMQGTTPSQWSLFAQSPVQERHPMLRRFVHLQESWFGNRHLLTVLIACSVLLAPFALFVGYDSLGSPSINSMSRIMGWGIMFSWGWIPLILWLCFLGVEKSTKFSIFLSLPLFVLSAFILSCQDFAVPKFFVLMIKKYIGLWTQ